MVQIQATSIQRGTGIWSREPVIRLSLAIEVPGDAPGDGGDALAGRLRSLVPSLPAGDDDHAEGDPGIPGIALADLVRRLAVEAQRLAGAGVVPGYARPAATPGRFDVVYGYEVEEAGVAAGELAAETIDRLLRGDEGHVDFARAAGERVGRQARRFGYGPSTDAIVRAARARDIPVLRLDPDRSLVQLGQGRHQRRAWTTVTSGTSDLGAKVALDKALTSRILRDIGIPAAAGVAVRDADEAVRQAGRLGYPVVLKPLDGNHGRGVELDLADEAAVRRAFGRAAAESRDGRVLVETLFPGRDYRVLVVGGAVAAVAERVPAHVVGDGESTVAALVERTNADPRRGAGHELALTRIEIDQASLGVLAAQGLDPRSVPAAAQVVALKRTANMSTGGTAIDRTDEINPDNARAATDAALTVGLDVAGIDLVVPDIARSWRKSGGGIVEVNAGPGLRMHTHPTEGASRPVGRAIVDHLFPAGATGRVPVLAVTGTNGKTTTTRMIAHVMRAAGHTVGMTSTDGIEIGGELVASGDMAGPASARLVLRHPRVDCAVLETARGGILRSGLGFDRCDVAVVTNVASDHLGLGGIDTLDELARVKAVLPSAVADGGASVLNADNRYTAAMAADARGEVILFGMDEHSATVRDHVGGGGRAVVLGAGDVILLLEPGGRTEVMAASELPATAGGRVRVNIANAMAATAAAVARRVPLETIRAALATFGNGYGQTPGRFNLLTIEGREVLVDYGHNVEALLAVGEFVRRTGAPSSVGVITSPGDRRDEDIAAFGEAAAGIFDHLVIRDGSTLRDRAPGEMAGLLRAAALRAGFPEDRITVVDGDLAAANLAIDLAAPGDLVHVMTERIAATWDELVRRRDQMGEASGTSTTPGVADRVASGESQSA